MKKGNLLKIIVVAIFGIILLGFIGMFILFHTEMSIVRSIEKYGDDRPFYYMEFRNGYHLDEIMSKDISSDKELADVLSGYLSHGFYKADTKENLGTHIGCSTFTSMTEEGNMVYGRNYDWYEPTPIVVLATPRDGYASISTCEFSNITGNASIKPEGLANSFLAAASYYVPMDGVNEKGLCVAILEVNEGGQEIVDTEKLNITVTMATRLLLDRAADIDEAINLLNQYDICPTGGISTHLSISDSTGRSVVCEFMDGKVVVLETPCVTNFNMANGDIDAGGLSPKNRYLTLLKINEQSKGVMSADDMRNAMAAVSQKEGKWQTRWTVIYENKGLPGRANLDVSYYWFGDYKNRYRFSIK